MGAITLFEGRVAQYLGDGVLAHFGHPVALEGGAERAIRAGLAVIERVRELSAQLDQSPQVRTQRGKHTSMCATLFMSFVSGRVVPAMALVTSSAQPRVRGGLMSLNSALQHLSSGLASPIAGMIIGQSATGAPTRLWLVGLIAVGCTFLAIAISRRIEAVS